VTDPPPHPPGAPSLAPVSCMAVPWPIGLTVLEACAHACEPSVSELSAAEGCQGEMLVMLPGAMV